MEVFFCDRCSIRLTDGDFPEGRAVRVKDFCFCKQCWDESEVRSAIEKVTGSHTPVDPGQQPQREGHATPRSARRAASGSSAEATRRGRAKTPRRAGGSRRSPTRGRTPARGVSPARGTPRARTPVPRGRRHTPSPARAMPAVGAGAIPAERAPGSRATTRRGRPEGAPSSSNTMVLVAVCVAGGLILGLLGMVLFSSGKPRREARRTDKPGRQERVVDETGKAVWRNGGLADGDIVEYSGKLSVKDASGSVSAKFPATGTWTVEFSDVEAGLAFLGAASAGERKLLGPAQKWLSPGANAVRATFQGSGAAGPPVVEVVAEHAAGPDE